MRVRLYGVVLIALILTCACWSVDAFKVTKNAKNSKKNKQKKQNNQFFNSAKEKWNNQLGQPLSLECDEKNGEGVYQVRSEFHPNEKDRQYRWKCHTVATEPMTDCTWSNEINEFQGSLLYMCPANFVITGISSTYDRKQQDRKWKIKCCRANNHFTRACKISETINRFGKPFFYTAKDECSDPGVMTGLASEMNREKLKDREWKVVQCSYANQRSCKYKCNSIRSRNGRKKKHKRKGRKRAKKVHKEESSVAKSKIGNENIEESEHHSHHNQHSQHHRNDENNKHHHHHTKHHKKRRNHKFKASNAKAEKRHHSHKNHHRHRPHHHRHRPHHRHHHVSAINTVEAKPTQQPTEKLPSTVSPKVPIVSGIPKSPNRNAYYPVPFTYNSLPMSLMKQTPTQPQQNPLSSSPITNTLESSLPQAPPIFQPLNDPRSVLPLSPLYWGQPNSIPVEKDLFQPPYTPLYNSRYPSFLRARQTPFQILQDLTLHPQNEEFGDIHSYLKSLPLPTDVEHYWLGALYRIQELLNWLPPEDRSELRRGLRVIIERHLHKALPSISVESPENSIIPEKEPINVHIHLPRSDDSKQTNTASKETNDDHVMQKINEILSKFFPANSKDVHFEAPGSRKNQMASGNVNNHGVSNKQPHYLLDNDYNNLIPPELASKLENTKTELLKRLYS